MIDFVNTLDTIDDVVLADKLINRSIYGVFNDDKIVTIGSGAFAYCKNLESVCFPVATSIGAGAFKGSGLKAITPETFPFVTNIPYMSHIGVFNESALETVDWPSLISTKEDFVFRDCKSLKSVNLPNLTVHDGFSFANCTSLTDVNLPLVTTCPFFAGCTALETITLPCVTSANGSNWDSIFSVCTKLRMVDLPSCTKIEGQYGWRYCNALEAVILRSTTMCTATGAIFKGSSIANGEGYIYVPKALIDSYKAATNWSLYAAQFRAIEDYPDVCGG